MKKILIAEDEKVMRSMLADYLENFDYELLLAEDGQIAWDIWNNTACDLLISDINMPNMGGIDLLRNIKQTDPNFPVIIITGVNVENAQGIALDNGANAFLIKPFKMKALMDEINKLFPDEE
jgi:CheY-like chemotaxis protein